VTASLLAAAPYANGEPFPGMLDASEVARLGPRNCDTGFDRRRLLPSSGAPIVPLTAAAMAAVELMLFRRVTRCAGFIGPAEMVWACGRALGREPATLLECRC
jgi:hypothetical protein